MQTFSTPFNRNSALSSATGRNDFARPPVPRSTLHGYVNPNVLSSMTYHRMATVRQTGTTTTSTYLYEANNSAWTFSDKFTLSMWINPKEIPNNNGLALIRRWVANVSGDYLIDLQPQTVSGVQQYYLRFYVGNNVCNVTTKLADSTVLTRPFGHIIINYDGSRTANDRVRFCVNGTDYTIGAGNLTAYTNAPTTLPANTRDIHIGGTTATDQGQNAGICNLQVWNDDKWASRSTLYNSGIPLSHSQLGALNDSSLKRSVDFDDNLDPAVSTQQYYQCKKTSSNSFSPRRSDNGSWLCQPESYFCSRINNLAPTGGYWYWPCGGMPELLHTSLRSTATTGLYDRGVLKAPAYNQSFLGSCTPVNTGLYVGDVSAISSALHGDAFLAIAHIGVLAGLGGTNGVEQFFMGPVNAAGNRYLPFGISPSTLPANPPMRPTIRTQTDATTAAADFSGVNVSAGDKLIHQFGMPTSRGPTDTYYRRTNLADSTTTNGTLVASNPASWFGDVASPIDLVLYGHSRTSCITNAEFGIYVWGSGWNTSNQNAVRTWIAKQYGKNT
jgi:hypothetical protein